MSGTNLQVNHRTPGGGWAITGRSTATLFGPTLTYQSVGAEATGVPRTVQTFASHSASWAGVSGSGTAAVFAAADNTTYSNMDIYGRVSASGPGVKLVNCRIRGYLVSPWVGESTLGLIHLTNANVTGLVAEDCTLIPDYPSPDWDCLLGHGWTLRRCLLAHGSDLIGLQNTSNNTDTEENVIDTCYLNWLTFWTPEPAGTTPNNDAKSHNDCIQITHPLKLTIRNSNISCHFSMPAGMGVLDDPFGYAGVGGDAPATIPTASDGTAPNAPYYPSPCGNAAIQFNSAASSGKFNIDGTYLDGGAATLNIPTPVSEVQRLTVLATGGSIKLKTADGAHTTAAINVSGMTAASIQSALRAAVPAYSGVTVSTSPNPFTITFPMNLGNVGQLTVDTSLAIGGGATVATIVTGVATIDGLTMSNSTFGHNQRAAGTGSGFGTNYLGRVRPSSDPLYNDTATVIATSQSSAVLSNLTYLDNGVPIHVR